MAHYWLINGPTALLRPMALGKNPKKEAEMASRKRRSRRHKNPHRRSRRYHRNAPGFIPSASQWQSVGSAILWPLGAYAVARFGQRVVSNWLPAGTPVRPIVSAAIPALAAWMLVRAFVKADAARHYAEAGALFGFGEALASATGLSPLLGTAPQMVMVTPPAPGMSALIMDGQGNMGAALEAALEDPYQQPY